MSTDNYADSILQSEMVTREQLLAADPKAFYDLMAGRVKIGRTLVWTHALQKPDAITAEIERVNARIAPAT